MSVVAFFLCLFSRQGQMFGADVQTNKKAGTKW
ncbi:hypothetical protein predicted by Glimmer/Critica [Acetobacter ghanensis]|uniref:Uncharacterized protein n=1 Tax=Acetobacter ghanensis TaxID=431306 RepID=A0A0U5F916_9PROT|nr:hypothetical protein predicted by Glimmer/Critica [Acetobacter ghanensis]